jgi:hypothetical protein
LTGQQVDGMVGRMLRRACALIVVLVAGAVAPSLAGAGAGAVPELAGPWSLHQEGYGHVKPRTVFNGGDPTGLVRDIRWSSWGGARAVGIGTAEWVGPHQGVAQGRFEPGVRIVLFQLGTCHGRRAYDAIEWYFPRHGQYFSAGTYINACTGSYYYKGRKEA